MSFAPRKALAAQRKRSPSEIFREINISRGSWPLIVIVEHRTRASVLTVLIPQTQHGREPRKDFEVGREPLVESSMPETPNRERGKERKGVQSSRPAK